MRNAAHALFLALGVLFCGGAQSAVLTGPVSAWAEDSNYTFGDALHDFTIIWSTQSVLGGNGYFYGSEAGSLYPDFFVVSGGVEVTTVSDASVFSFRSSAENFNEGDTIFLRNADGYYAALQVDEIYPNPAGQMPPFAFLNGTWYFQDNGSADFTVPVPAALWLFASAIVTLFIRRRSLVTQ